MQATEIGRLGLGVAISVTMLILLSARPIAEAEAMQAQEKKNPLAGKPEAAAEGRALYMKWGCYGCHGTQGGGGMGPSLADDQWLYGDSDQSVFQSIHAGRPNGMPPWSEKLSEEEIWKLVTYIRSIQKSTPS